MNNNNDSGVGMASTYYIHTPTNICLEKPSPEEKKSKLCRRNV